MSRHTECLSDEELVEVESGSSERPELLEHLEACGICADRLTRYRQARDELGELFRSRRPCDQKVDDHLWALAGDGWSRLNESNTAVHVPKPRNDRKTNGQKAAGYRFDTGNLFGDFAVVRPLDRGGQSEVYLVKRRGAQFETLFVAKVCKQWQNPGSREDLRQEAAILEKLRGCAGIVQFQHLHELDLGTGTLEPVLVLEFVDGLNLKQAFARYRDNPQQAIHLLKRLGEILEQAHRRGVVHGDLKPANIVVGQRDDDLRIIDFGLAMRRSVYQSGADQQTVGGTAIYMAPEQARANTESILAAADVFSLGAIMQELLAAKSVYEGTEYGDILDNARQGRVELATPDRLPFRGPAAFWQRRRVWGVMKRSLSADPNARFADGGAFAQAIEPGKGRALLLVTALLVLLIPAVFLIASNLSSTGSSGPPPEPGPIAGILTLGEKPTPLVEILPIKVGQSLRLEAVAPADLEWVVVWVGGSKEIYEYTIKSEELPLSITPDANNRNWVKVSWPSSTDGVKITGDGGTEMLLLIGMDPDKNLSVDSILKCVRDAIAAADEWPRLPDELEVRCDLASVQVYEKGGKRRGPGEVKTVEYLQVVESIDRVRTSLREHGVFLRGEAFPVILPPSN